MELTKWEHACMVLEQSDHRLIIDPGAYTPLLDAQHNVLAVVITHEHADHWTPEQLAQIIELNPHVRIFGTAATAIQAAKDGVAVAVEPVEPGDRIELGPFRLAFFGGDHAIIHSSIPQIRNVGVLVNEQLYYPGDSFFVPDVPVPVLAAPASAPWLKAAEAMDFVLAVAPRRCFQAHEMVNSQIGNDMANARLAWATEQGGGEFRWLEPGEKMLLA